MNAATNKSRRKANRHIYRMAKRPDMYGFDMLRRVLMPFFPGWRLESHRINVFRAATEQIP